MSILDDAETMVEKKTETVAPVSTPKAEKQSQVYDKVDNSIAAKPRLSTKVDISIDNSVDQVLQYDKEGAFLVFGVGARFIELPEEVVQKLGFGNMQSYRYAKLTQKEWKEQEKQKDLAGVQGFADFVSPDRKLRLDPGADGFDGNDDPNWHYYWAGAWEVGDRIGQGYEYAPAGSRVTFAGTASDGKLRISFMGKDELVLMRIPQVKHREIRARGSKKSSEMVKGHNRETVNMLKKQGAVPYEDNGVNDRNDWTKLGGA